MTSTYLGVTYGLLALVGLGLGAAISKGPSKTFRPLKLVFYRNLFTSTFLLIALVAAGGVGSFGAKDLFTGIAVSIVGFFPLFFFYKSIERGKMGIIAPIAYSSSVVSVILATFIYKEPLSIIQAAAIILIVVGIILSSINLKDFKQSAPLKISSGVPMACLACLGWGIFYFLYRTPSRTLGALFAAFLAEFVIMLVALVYLKLKKEKISLTSSQSLKPILLVALLGAGGSLAYTEGLRVSDINVVVPISSATMAVVAIYGRLVYKEKLSLLQYMAIAIIFGGIVILSLSQ